MLQALAEPVESVAPETGVGSGLRTFRPTRPQVHAERILRIQGYSDLDRVRPVIRRAAQDMAGLAMKLSEPAVAWRLVPIVGISAEGVVRLPHQVELRCEAFPRQLAGCDELAPFVLTVGRALSEAVVELVEKGDLLEGLLLEAAGWLAIEDATRQFKAELRSELLARGRRMTSRLGPGYSYKVDGRMCMWGLEEQPALFSLLGSTGLPVTLMASCAMSPKMSRSGMYGTAPESKAPRGGRSNRNTNRGAGR